jgi:hypothetical protein
MKFGLMWFLWETVPLLLVISMVIIDEISQKCTHVVLQVIIRFVLLEVNTKHNGN